MSDDIIYEHEIVPIDDPGRFAIRVMDDGHLWLVITVPDREIAIVFPPRQAGELADIIDEAAATANMTVLCRAA